jgi:hypothetical protein
MPPGEEGSTHGNIADGDAPRRRQRRRRIFRRSTEKKNPENLEFVCAIILGLYYHIRYIDDIYAWSFLV